jgi:hypothetical protein
MTEDVFESAARSYERAAEELERAVAHLRVTAQHFRNRDVPRGCAHAFATRGHVINAQNLLDELARLHASRARPEI